MKLRRLKQFNSDLEKAKAWLVAKEQKTVVFSFGGDDTHMIPKMTDKELIDLWRKEAK